MKNITILLLMAVLARPTHAQGFFNQQGARIKNLAKQIALFKTYTAFLQKGYSIAKDGLNTIGNIKRGDLRIHTDHFAALSRIKPAIDQYAQALDILRINTAIKKLAKPDNAVYRQLLERCTANMEAFNQLLTRDQYKLSDAERLGRIRVIYHSMQDMLAFAQYYAAEQSLLKIQVKKESNDINGSRLLYSVQTP